ncbi:3-deoxy-D-manno-octulosonic acid transferase [Moheibacter sp.]|uniref:3-deoxy-D-manno-octulosonic acid transferase n=1 Tax=Moheibacter sp. TaxID=1965316 RepID=UPI003C790AFD
MQALYTFFIQMYGFAVSIAAHFNPKAKLWISGRKSWKNKMKQAISPDDKIIWVHCSSLGEFEQGRPVMEKIKKDFPYHKLAVSFFSPSGYEVRKDYQGADYIFYLPLDTPKNAKQLIKILHPEVLILVKYEYWYNLLKRLQKKDIPVLVISAVIKEDNLFFRPFGSWFRKIIAGIEHFFVQDNDSKNLLESIGIENVRVSGDTRFDRVKEIREANVRVEFIEKFKGNSKLIVAGSTWPDDEEILVKFINEKMPDDWKLIFAPHNIKEKEIISLSEKVSKKTAIYTKSDQNQIENSQILILDTIGMLTKIYAYSDVSYVGGGFTKTGVHNTLEPTVFGVPIIFGPNYENYFEAIDLLENQGAVRFIDQYDFDQKMTNLIENEDERKRRGNAAENYIQGKPNSTELIIDYLKSLIKK